MQLLAIVLLVVILNFNCCSTTQWKNISAVTLEFTSCNATGREGPTYSSCSNYYKPLIRHSLTNVSTIEGFHGGQTFKFPKSGTYNVTVAGSSGGRGLCNIKKARGAIIEGQLVIQEGVNDSILIMVGQKGLSPCDVNPDYHLCLDPPGNLTEANVCLQNWTSQMGSIGSLWSRLGGGGGGGASMIWVAANSSGYFNQSMLPFMIAGGGGGTSLKTEYSRILGIYFNIDITALKSPNETPEEFYQRWIDAKPSENDGFLQTDNLLGFPGNRPNIVGEGAAVVSGAGGGWKELFTFRVEDIDGNLLSRNTHFAQGGLNCVSGLNLSESGLLFQSVNGGFGGGGGSCDEGGGGGGYGGGSVLTDNSGIPGSGGYSLPGEEGIFTGFNEGDGYVIIIPVDCFCSYQCITENMMYMCVCPESATLASDEIDCYSTVSDYRKYGTTFSTPLQIANLSIQSSVVSFETIQQVYDITVAFDEASCIVIWLNENKTPVLISEPSNKAFQSNILDSLHTISTNGNRSESRVNILNESVSVAAGIILGKDNCTINNINLKASIVSGENFTDNIIDLQSFVNNFSFTISSIVLNNFADFPSPFSTSYYSPPTTTLSSLYTSSLQVTSTTPSSTIVDFGPAALLTQDIIIIVLATILFIIFIIIIIGTITVVMFVLKWRRKRKSEKINNNFNHTEISLDVNKAYETNQHFYESIKPIDYEIPTPIAVTELTSNDTSDSKK